MSIWDFVQQVQIENLKARQISGESEADRAASRTRALNDEVQGRVERLVLVTEAMWELVSQRTELTVADLVAKVREIDARDGRQDARRGPIEGAPAVRCPSCQAVVPPGKSVCQFCGATVPEAEADPFRV